MNKTISNSLRPSKETLIRIGKDWADKMGYKIYANGRLKSNRGVFFQDFEELGRFCVKGCLVVKNGKDYYLNV